MHGLLWYDGSKRPLAERLAPALQRCRERLGGNVERVLVNARDANETVRGVVVEVSSRVLKGHLWLVVEDEPVIVAENFLGMLGMGE